MLCIIFAMLIQSVAVSAKDVCISGYIMDRYCIGCGTLLDNPKLDSLDNPDKHTVHCLVDVGNCRESAFELLVMNPKGTSPTYCRAYVLDAKGQDEAIKLARATGVCTTCDAGGTLKEGFRVTVWGKVSGSGDSSTPPTIEVTKLVTPGVDACAAGETVPDEVVCEQGFFRPWYIGHGFCMLLGWGLMLPTGVLAARFLKHRPNALWFKIHKNLQPTGLVVALVGFVIALTQFNVFVGEGGRALGAIHGGVGITVMTLGLLQPVNAYFRPHVHKGQPKSASRVRWECLHKNSGRTAVVLGVINAGIGMTLPGGSVTTGFMVAYFVVLVALAGLAAYFLRDRSAAGGASGSGEAHKATTEMADTTHVSLG